MPSRNAAKPQSLKTVPSGKVAVLKYPRLVRRLLGMTLTVTLSPTFSKLTGTLRLSNAFLSDHSMIVPRRACNGVPEALTYPMTVTIIPGHAH